MNYFLRGTGSSQTTKTPACSCIVVMLFGNFEVDDEYFEHEIFVILHQGCKIVIKYVKNAFVVLIKVEVARG